MWPGGSKISTVKFDKLYVMVMKDLFDNPATIINKSNLYYLWTFFTVEIGHMNERILTRLDSRSGLTKLVYYATEQTIEWCDESYNWWSRHCLKTLQKLKNKCVDIDV